MKIYAVSDGATPEYNQTVRSLFHLNGHGRIRAGVLQSDGIGEGQVRHVPADRLPVSVINLQQCSAVLYCYMKNDDLKDVVAFHAPSGSLDFKNDSRTGKFGTPTDEATYYGITGYDGIYVVIANGEKTCKYGRNDRMANINQGIKEGLRYIVGMLNEDKNVSEERILLYDCVDALTFGVSGAKHIGEPGDRPQQMVQAEIKSKKRSCFLTTAAVLALEKGDDCLELETLRWFRDQVLPNLPNGRESIQAYYDSAPLIVSAIDEQPDRADIYRRIYRFGIEPAVAAIRSGQFLRAFEIYRELVLHLKKEYLSAESPRNDG